MTILEIKTLLRRCLPTGNVNELKKLLQQYPNEVNTVNSTGIRDIDFLVNEAIVQNHNDDQTLELCRALFAAGADPNVSYYIQSQVGFLHQAAERSLELVKLFVEQGAQINHDLFGKPACWAMISAVCACKLDIIQYLYEQGAVINFVNIHGMSPLDYVYPPRPDVRKHPDSQKVIDWLLAHGAKSGRDLPKDHLPAQETNSAEAVERYSIDDHIVEHFGETEYFPYELELNNNSSVWFWIVKSRPGNPPMIALVTDGLSMNHMKIPDPISDGIAHAEFIMMLPPDWPITAEGMPEPKFRWPYEWLCELVSAPFKNGTFYRPINIISNGEPPEPLGEDFPMTCLLVRTVDAQPWGTWTRPDGVVVKLMLVTPLYTSERNAERKLGGKQLVNLLDTQESSYVVNANRPPLF